MMTSCTRAGHCRGIRICGRALLRSCVSPTWGERSTRRDPRKKQIGDKASQPHQGFRKQYKRLPCDPFRVPGLGWAARWRIAASLVIVTNLQQPKSKSAWHRKIGNNKQGKIWSGTLAEIFCGFKFSTEEASINHCDLALKMAFRDTYYYDIAPLSDSSTTQNLFTTESDAAIRWCCPAPTPGLSMFGPAAADHFCAW